MASVIFRNLSEVTAGDGARYDLELVNSAAWLAFFLFTLAAGMLTIVFLLRPLERLWLKRGKSH